MENYQLLKILNELLKPEQYKDYCPNGLQVEGDKNISKIITGVSLNEKLIDTAIDKKANAIIVHHGIFWNKDSYVITGIKKIRIEKLIKNNINLYAYHLPLDNHLSIGNNVELAKVLGIKVLSQDSVQNLIWLGELEQPVSLSEFAHRATKRLLHKPLIMSHDDNKIIKKIAWCTGGADSFFSRAIELGVDAYISGEASEPVYSLAHESGVAYIAAGHYATERYGVMALGEYLAKSYGVSTEYIELYNPI
jgi:dinuclear metal center YbgI/SA1388 family protein